MDGRSMRTWCSALPIGHFAAVWLLVLPSTIKSATNSQQQSMFINVVETMKHPQFIALPSLIWLDTAKHLYSVWPQALYYSLQSGFEFRGTIPDNELVSFLRTGFSCRPTTNNCCAMWSRTVRRL